MSFRLIENLSRRDFAAELKSFEGNVKYLRFSWYDSANPSKDTLLCRTDAKSDIATLLSHLFGASNQLEERTRYCFLSFRLQLKSALEWTFLLFYFGARCRNLSQTDEDQLKITKVQKHLLTSSCLSLIRRKVG